MLNKVICIKCWYDYVNNNTEGLTIEAWNNNDEESWNKEGLVACNKKGVAWNKEGEINFQTISIKILPNLCPYKLEHILSNSLIQKETC